METLDAYLTSLASPEPTPGGGSAASLVAATGAALLAMVARLTARAPRHADVRAEAAELAEEADLLRAGLLKTRHEDEAAYGAVVAARRLPQTTEAEKLRRSAALKSALTAAAIVPLDAAALSLEELRLAERALALGNAHLASDVGSAAEFALAALHAYALTVRINHRHMKSPSEVADQAERLELIEHEAEQVIERVRRGTRA